MELSISVVIFSISALVISLLQTGLMLGAPWGECAMGGVHPGRFPVKLRISAAVQLGIIMLSWLLVLVRARVVLSEHFEPSRFAIWFVVGLFAISSVLNIITSSRKERILGAPIAMMMFLSSLSIAMS